MCVLRISRQILLLLLVTTVALSGCVGTNSQSITILEHSEMQNITLQIGNERTFELTLEPSDAVLKLTSKNPEIVAITVLDGNKLAVTALEAGSTTITVVAEKQGYKDSVFSFTVRVIDADAPAWKEISILPAEHVAEHEQCVEIFITTANLADGTLIEVDILDEDVYNAATLIDNFAALDLTIPADFLGQYKIRISSENLEPYLKDYLVIPTNPSPINLTEIYALNPNEDCLAGELLKLNIFLWQEGQLVEEGTYELIVSSTQDGVLYTNPSCPFENGKAEITLTSPIIQAGEHLLLVESHGAEYHLTVHVSPAPISHLKLTTILKDGIANEPLLEPPTVALFDEFNNIISESGHTITLSTSEGFIGGEQHSVTDDQGLATFDNLVLYEGEYALVFAHDQLELNVPLKVDLQGAGEENSPYFIFNLYGLQSIRENPTAHYQLVNNIDGLGMFDFAPIKNFAGSLVGNNYTINDLAISFPGDNQVGLFASITTTGFVADLTLKGTRIYGKDNVGALAGRNEGQIFNCQVVDNEVTGETAVGGLVGFNQGVIERSHSHGVTSAQKALSYVGGLVGINKGRILQSYALGSAHGDTVGGLVGHNQNHGSGIITESYAAVSLSGTGNLGGLTGLNFGSVDRSYFDETLIASSFGAGIGQPTKKMKTQETFQNWDFLNAWDIDSTINQGYPYLRH